MKDSKLLRFLSALPKKELADFQYYVDCPLFNRRKSLRRLLRVLLSHKWTGEGMKDKVCIYRQVYGEQSYNDRSMRTGLSQLFALLRQYLAFVRYQEDTWRQRLYFLDYLGESHSPFWGEYWERSHLELQELEHQGVERDARWGDLLDLGVLKFGEGLPSRVLRRGDEADLFKSEFLFKWLRMELCGEVSERKMEQGKDKHDLLERVLEGMKKPALEIQVYAELFRLDGGEQKIEALARVRQLLAAGEGQIAASEVERMYEAGVKRILHLFKARHPAALTEGRQWFRQMKAQGIYPSLKRGGGVLRLQERVEFAIACGEFTWVCSLLETGEACRERKIDPLGEHLCRGMLAFARGEFFKARSLFIRVLQEYEQLALGLRAWSYLLRTQFEMHDSLALERSFEVLGAKLGRLSKKGEALATQLIDFLGLLERFWKTGIRDRRALEELQTEVLESGVQRVEGDWLLGKIADVLRLESQLC